jgi:hypothetical protein
MTILRKAVPEVYRWLNQNDSDWLKRNCPKPAKHKFLICSVDWESRDSEFNALVKETADQIRVGEGRPVRVTQTAIARELGAVSMFQKHLPKMPLTKRTFMSVMESSADFSIRRVWWAANCYLQEGLMPQQWQLMLRANVYRNREVHKVRQAILSGLKMLRSKLFVQRGAAA